MSAYGNFSVIATYALCPCPNPVNCFVLFCFLFLFRRRCFWLAAVLSRWKHIALSASSLITIPGRCERGLCTQATLVALDTCRAPASPVNSFYISVLMCGGAVLENGVALLNLSLDIEVFFFVLTFNRPPPPPWGPRNSWSQCDFPKMPK